MSKDYSENSGEPGGEASLSEQVKGSKVNPKASFKPLSHPGAGAGAGDDEKFKGFGDVKNDVKAPEEPSKSLGRSPGKV